MEVVDVLKPFVTADWWTKTLDIIGRMAREAACYVMRFDKSREVVGEIIELGGSEVQRFRGHIEPC